MIRDFDFINTCDISGFIKEDIRAIVLYKSNINENEVVLDINAGVGEISAEFSKLAKETICIDSNENAIEISKENIKKHGNIDKAKFINKDEITALEEIDDFDVAILKLKENNIDSILDIIHNKINSKGRIIILTNIVDFVSLAVNKLSEFY